MLNDLGRPQSVYSRRSVKTDWVRHEVLLTEFLLRTRPESIVRGNDVDPEVRPDAEIVRNGLTVNVELDTGECGYEQVMRRFRVYRDVDDLVLWVTLSEARMAGLMHRADMISSTALFTTLDSDVWCDLNGKQV